MLHVTPLASARAGCPAARLAPTHAAAPAHATGHSGAPANDMIGYATSTATTAISTVRAPDDSGGAASHAPSAGASSTSAPRKQRARAA
jgi:hypothetical protein